ncbi:MAG: hypothetical protein K8I03_11645 [Ignavibacteria bacterium]|nr:hypothetical protein [Ignavibacteria bacterium]
MVKKKKTINKNDIRHWAEPLLQGLTFWLGYKEQLFPNYQLSEGAIIGEAVQLFYSHLRNNEEKLDYEVMYKTFGINDSGLTRADLVIMKRKEKKTDEDEILSVIEVKRTNNDGLFRKDFLKLLKVKKQLSDARCFLLLVCQGFRPDLFVSDTTGRAKRKVIFDNDYKLYVRFVRKASKHFDIEKRANYACLIEVLLPIKIKE